MNYDPRCSGCSRSQGVDGVPGGIAKLPGEWIVNQYQGTEGYLGWLALQPRNHRMALADLTPHEAASLGPNLQALDEILTRYWTLEFPSDPVERVYAVYFFESPLAQPPPKEMWHLHIHVIPRPRDLAQSGLLGVTKNGETWSDGWLAPRIFENQSFPERYRLSAENRVERSTKLMDYIRHELAVRP